MRFSIFALLLLALAACSSSPSPVLPPVKLEPLQQQIPVTRLWKLRAGEGAGEFYLKLRPVFSGDTGYVVDYKGSLLAFDVKTGSEYWQYELHLPVASGLVLYGNRLYLGTSKGEVIAFELGEDSAAVVWRKQLSSEVLARVAIAQNVLVARTIDGRVYGLDANTGQQYWVYDRTVPRLTLRGSSTPVIVNDMVMVASDNGKLAGLTLKTGNLLWETTIAVAKGRNQLERVIDLDVDPVVIDDVVYVAGYQGRIAAVKIASGQLLWSRDFSTWSGMYVDAYRVYVTDAQGHVWALNRYNGATLWRQDKLLRRKVTAPQTQGDYLVVGDYDGYLHWLERESGKLVARKKIFDSRVMIDDIEAVDDEEDNELFSKWNNILLRPVRINQILLAIDRVGHIETFALSKK